MLFCYELFSNAKRWLVRFVRLLRGIRRATPWPDRVSYWLRRFRLILDWIQGLGLYYNRVAGSQDPEVTVVTRDDTQNSLLVTPGQFAFEFVNQVSDDGQLVGIPECRSGR
ncbi:MAG TPA: hypothetical protein VN999_00285 [Thermoanaerobaculia bacterium]|nr:hypothetical protein [Thermoanaerobaculia bacterium]